MGIRDFIGWQFQRAANISPPGIAHALEFVADLAWFAESPRDVAEVVSRGLETRGGTVPLSPERRIELAEAEARREAAADE